MGRKLSDQEKLAGRVSRAAQGRTAWCKNLDGTIDVFVRDQGVVFVISRDCGVRWRYASGMQSTTFIGSHAQIRFGQRIVKRFTPPQICKWFSLCDHTANGTLHHPILGDVPICDRCRAKVGALSNA